MFSWLANWFASPWLLSGLALAGAPILIHLLYRRKLRETSWAAMRFLLEAARKNSRRLRLEQLLLLAIRTLLILLAVFALAEPLVNRAGALFQSGMPVHRIVVIDTSASLGAEPGSEPLFAQARRIAREIVERSRQGDAVNLARLASLPPRVIVQTPAFSTGPVLEEIDRLEVLPAPAALSTSLEEVLPLLRLAPEIRRKEVYLISDFQRSTWDAADADALTRLRGRLKQVSDLGQLLLIDVGQSGMANAGITRIESLDPVVIAGAATRLRVSVRNYGHEPLSDRDLQLWVDDRLVDRRTISLAAGAEGTEVFSPVLATAGGHRLEARLGTDALMIDNRRWLALSAKDRLRVLCVNGGGSGRTLRRAADFLALALAPASRGSSRTSLEQSGSLEPTIINEGELSTLDLALFDCVYFCNVRRFTERETATLTRFVRAGGGVVFCCGDQVQPREYNEQLYRQGQGLLPARLGERRGDPGRRDSLFRFDPGGFNHPVVGAFQGNPDAGLESTVTYAYLTTSGIAEAAGRVALKFDDGEPAIIEKSVGLGKSILVTTTMDDEWTLWPLWPSYVPLVQELSLFAVSGRSGQTQKLVGESLEGTVPPGAGDAEVLIGRPDGERESVRPAIQGDESRFAFGPATQIGIYDARIPPPALRDELFAVNLDPIEGNLANYSAEELRAGLLSGIDATFSRTPDTVTVESAEVPRPVSGGLTRPLLYLLLYLLFVEQALAWNFPAGLWLLCPPAALGLWWSRRKPV